MKSQLGAILCSLFGLVILLSCLAGFDAVHFPMLRISRPNPPGVIPGCTRMKHCDDPLDPPIDLFRLHRLMINPNPPIIGRNFSISAFGRFTLDVSSNATAFFFVDADHAGLVGYGFEDFCNSTTVIQTIDGVAQHTCPPFEGSAFLKRNIFIEDYWPAGLWYVHIDVRDSYARDAARLFCVDGEIQVRR